MMIIIISALLCAKLDKLVINQIACVLKPLFSFSFLKMDS
jgi:hypothetical protein